MRRVAKDNEGLFLGDVRLKLKSSKRSGMMGPAERNSNIPGTSDNPLYLGNSASGLVRSSPSQVVRQMRSLK